MYDYTKIYIIINLLKMHSEKKKTKNHTHRETNSTVEVINGNRDSWMNVYFIIIYFPNTNIHMHAYTQNWHIVNKVRIKEQPFKWVERVKCAFFFLSYNVCFYLGFCISVVADLFIFRSFHIFLTSVHLLILSTSELMNQQHPRRIFSI